MSKRSMNNYHLHVTAGPSRDPKQQKPVQVNSDKPLHFDTENLKGDVYVRIQNYRGPPGSNSTSPYFSSPKHTNDQYSISFSPLTFKSHVPGDDLVLGNDFDEPINQSLPPGFSVAWRVARWVVDPGLEGDPWAEKPWLEGRVLGSVNVMGAGGKHEEVLEETLGKELGGGIPEDAAARMKYFLNQAHRKEVTFEKEKDYHLDFFNPYLDFNEFSLKLPGVSIKILKYWDGQPLRYVLRNRVDQTVYMVVQFTLVEKEDGDEDGEEEDEEDDDDEIDEHAGKEAEKAHKSPEINATSQPVADTSNDDLD